MDQENQHFITEPLTNLARVIQKPQIDDGIVANWNKYDNLPELQFLAMRYEFDNLQQNQKKIEKKLAYNRSFFYFAKIKEIKYEEQKQNNNEIDITFKYKQDEDKKEVNENKIITLEKINTILQKELKVQNKQSQDQIDFEKVTLPDGIYFLSNFKYQSTSDCKYQILKQLLRSVVRDVLFIHFIYNLVYILQALEKAEIPIDYTTKSIFLVKDKDSQQQVKFIIYPRLEEWGKRIHQLVTSNDISYGNEYTNIKKKYIQLQQSDKLKQYISEIMELFCGQDLQTFRSKYISENENDLDKCFINDLVNWIQDDKQLSNLETIKNLEHFKKKDTIEKIKKNQLLTQFQQDDKEIFKQRLQDLRQKEEQFLFEEKQNQNNNQQDINNQEQIQQFQPKKFKLLEELFLFISNERGSSNNNNLIKKNIFINFQKQQPSKSDTDLLLQGSISDQQQQGLQQQNSAMPYWNRSQPSKLISIEYMEKKNCLTVRISFENLALTIENSDEVIFSSQLIASKEKQILFDIDEKRRLTFRSTICIGQSSQILKKVIEMIDVCLIYAICFYEYYQSNILLNKSTKDLDKFSQLYSEMNFYAEDYIEEHRKFFQDIDYNVKQNK